MNDYKLYIKRIKRKVDILESGMIPEEQQADMIDNLVDQLSLVDDEKLKIGIDLYNKDQTRIEGLLKTHNEQMMKLQEEMYNNIKSMYEEIKNYVNKS